MVLAVNYGCVMLTTAVRRLERRGGRVRVGGEGKAKKQLQIETIVKIASKQNQEKGISTSPGWICKTPGVVLKRHPQIGLQHSIP